MKNSVIETIGKTLKKEGINLTKKEIEENIEIPRSPKVGDYAFPCFVLSSKLKKKPSQIAADLVKKINFSKKNFEEIKSVGPYLNFFVNKKEMVFDLIKKIEKEKDKFGSSKKEKKKKIMLEFSQANTHKAFHIGHLRGTSLGESLARILEFKGNEVIRTNYQGDTGMHIAKWIWCYKKYHAREKIKEDEEWIASIYVEAAKRLSGDESLQKEVDGINKKLSDGKDEKLNVLWKKTREISLKSFEKIYKELNTKFDCYFLKVKWKKKGKKSWENFSKRK